ncbi:hypothetical protein JCM9140_3340 [Halalkalibacter wakoensis JCM 9140]|uniref:Yip1 domain-containing protein n=1 Tax=Halalkalibacter wakoensis JCM 9140 TaxID=1236970 RepID=W4Q5D6_9BACI|nr:hypothetical protein [Halalkalibacter wakoensis]GAE27212.1 hypothetical protein JCM9140_3340 [Halalkalibacter wakoensis JCM 9140]
MTYQLQLIRSLVDPATKVDQLRFSEVIPIHLKKILLIFILSMFLAVVRGYYGLNTAGISHLISSYSVSQFEMAKLIVAIGGLIESLFSPAIYMILISLSFWAFLDEVRYRQALVVSTISVFILIVGEVFLLPFELLLGITAYTSPFALGILSHFITDNLYVIHFFSQISLFLVAAIAFQIYSFSKISSNGKGFIFLLTLCAHVLLILFAVFLLYLASFLTFNY